MQYKNLAFSFLLQLLCAVNVNAQYQHFLDSLKNDLKNAKEDTSMVSKLNLLCYAALEPAEQMDFAQRALALAQKVGYKKGEADALGNIGFVYHNEGNITKAMEHFEKSYEIFKNITYQIGIASQLNNIGWVYYNIGDVSRGLENFLKSLSILKNFKDTESKLGVGMLLNNIAFIYQGQKDYAKALEYYRQSQKVRGEVNDSIGLSTTFLNMGAVYKLMGQIPKGMEYSQKSLDIINSIGDKEGISSSLNAIGMMYEAGDSFQLALINYQKALVLNEEIGNNRQITSCLINIGSNLLKQKDFSEAEKYCKRALQLSKELGFPEYISKSGKYLSQIYEAQGKYKDAYEMQILFKQYSDSIYNTSNTKKLTQLQMQFDFDKQADSLKNNEQITGVKLEKQLLYSRQQQQQLELNAKELQLSNNEKNLQKLAYLKTQADLQNEQLEKQKGAKELTIAQNEKELQKSQVKNLSQQQALSKLKLQQQWIYSIAILVLLGLIASYFIYRNRIKEVRLKEELAKEKAEQEKKEAQFQRSLADVSLTALRSQMNPHFIFNCLNSIKLYTTQNDTAAATEYLSKFSKLIRLVMENSRNDRITLKSELDALRLYIEMEVMRFKEKLAYTINVDNNVEADYLEIPPLLLQPYVENSIWHGLMHKEEGGSIDIKVSMQKNESLLEISIIDNGIGRVRSAELRSKSATKHKSYGMRVTSERIALINQIYKTGANVVIHDLVDGNAELAGTEVIIQIPV